MAEYSISIDRGGAFRITPDLLNEIWDTGRAFLGSDVECTVSFEGGHRLSTTESEEFANDKLVKLFKIQSISLAGSVYGHKEGNRRFSCRLKTSNLLNTIDIELTGPQKDCASTIVEADAIINSGRMWYSFLFGKTPEKEGLVLGLVVGMLASVTVTAMTLLGTLASYFFSFAITAGAYLLLFLLFRSILFPKIIFDMGRSGESWKVRSSIRYFILGAVVVAFVVSVAASLLANLISK